ncbi:MAG: hypothetical protein ABIR58_07635 [Gemmatimonadaceae bacterium]
MIGVLVCLVAAGILYDAVSPEDRGPFRERRRRRRAEPNRAGEVLVGVGTLCMGAALIGRDEWRWGTVVVFAGVGLLVVGAVLNRVYLRETLMFRGASRRGGDDDPAPRRDEEKKPPMRID